MKTEELFELLKKDDEFKKFVLKLKENKSISKEDASKEIFEYLSKKDINVTKEDIIDLLNAKMFNPSGKILSSEELSSISAGGGEYVSHEIMCDKTDANCNYGINSGYHPEPGCSATVEIDSWCWSDDQCYLFDEHYSWKRN